MKPEEPITLETLTQAVRDCLAACWIAVEDALPPKPSRYLVRYGGGPIFVWWNGRHWVGQTDQFSSNHVTHWMPEPPAPANSRLA